SRGTTTSPPSPAPSSRERHAAPRGAAAQGGGRMMDGLDAAAPVLRIARSVTGRRWVWRLGDARTGLGIAQGLGVAEVVGRLLAGRGVGVEDAALFLEPTLRALLPDPSTLADMDAAADRLARAVREGERVAVFGD